MWNLGTNKHVSVTFIYVRLITQLKIDGNIVFDYETSNLVSFIKRGFHVLESLLPVELGETPTKANVSKRPYVHIV